MITPCEATSGASRNYNDVTTCAAPVGKQLRAGSQHVMMESSVSAGPTTRPSRVAECEALAGSRRERCSPFPCGRPGTASGQDGPSGGPGWSMQLPLRCVDLHGASEMGFLFQGYGRFSGVLEVACHLYICVCYPRSSCGFSLYPPVFTARFSPLPPDSLQPLFISVLVSSSEVLSVWDSACSSLCKSNESF